jgi:glycosyltransferase involved in cell wall biosynthesis
VRFHIPGLSHAKTTKEYSCCAFTQKIRLLAKMLHGRGHTVYFYGVEGSDPECTENVVVLDNEMFLQVHGTYDWKKDGWLLSRDNPAWKWFTANAVEAIRERARPEDFILCGFGWDHKAIADELPLLMAVESGIGYTDTWSKFRVFESYAHLHYHIGKEGRMLSPGMYDVVIPNYFDLSEHTFQEKKGDYFVFMGRNTPLKGLKIASDVCEKIGAKLVVACQGKPDADVKCEHVGVLSIEERDKLLGGARAVFVPTLYVEPFGTVAINAALCGTPTITTDFGAFTETVLHGKTGYRCRTFEQFVWAARNTHLIEPRDCRSWAEKNFSLERVGQMYDDYFLALNDLRTPEGWYQMRGVRSNLDWLRRDYS